MFCYAKQIAQNEAIRKQEIQRKLAELDLEIANRGYIGEEFRVQKAHLIATFAHGDDMDAGGIKYIYHPLTVAKFVHSDEAQTVALLHDVMEDTFIPQEWLSKHFSVKIIEALVILTHDKKKTYIEYIKRIKDSGNQLAIEVKIADLQHNFSRFMYELGLDGPIISDKNKYQRVMKYDNALDFLKWKINEMRDVDDQMWSQKDFVLKILGIDRRAVAYVDKNLLSDKDVQRIVGKIYSQQEILTKIKAQNTPCGLYAKRSVLVFKFDGNKSLIPAKFLQLIGKQIHASYSPDTFKQYEYLVLQYANDKFDCYLLDEDDFKWQYKEITIDDAYKSNPKLAHLLIEESEFMEIVYKNTPRLSAAKKHKATEMIKLSDLGFLPDEQITIMSSWGTPMLVTGDAFVALDDDDKFHIVTADNNGLPNMYDLVQK